MVQLPSEPVVQVMAVIVSSAPWGAAPPSGVLSTNRVNTAPCSGFPRSSCLWMLIELRARLVNVQVTVSPGLRLILVTGLLSEQVALTWSQPAGTDSAAL